MDLKKMSELNRANSAKTVSAEYDMGLRAYMLKIYNYMAAALAMTGASAMIVSSSEQLFRAIFGTPLAWVVILAPLGIVLYLSARLNKLSLSAAQGWFWAFAIVNGISLSTLFVAYTGDSIARAFFITAAAFGSLSLYGYTTKKDLTGMGSMLFMGLIGIVIASLVNLFMHSSALQFGISVLGVIIFSGLTAYDTQRLKGMYYSVAGHGEALGKVTIMGALSLYLDFINLFVMLMQLFGNRR